MYLYLCWLRRNYPFISILDSEIKRAPVALDRERENVGEVQLLKTKRKTTSNRRLMPEQRQKEEDDVSAIPEEVIIGTFAERHERTTNNLITTTAFTKFLEMLCYAAWA